MGNNVTRSKSFSLGVGTGFILGLILGGVLSAGIYRLSNSFEGGRRESCYPNNTCDSGLTCADKVCVKLPMHEKRITANAEQ